MNNPVLDLGEITEPLLIFGGPTSNLHATRALIAQARDLGIPPERWICTGDVAAYCADPEETAQLLRASGCHLVFGNCEDSLGNRLDDCGCGFSEGSACDALSGQWFAHADGQLSNQSRDWMRTAPRRINFRMAGLNFACVHGAPSRINQYVFASTPDALISAEIGAYDGIIAGHAGIPFTRNIAGKLWHNSGSIGMPANDGTPRVWYSLLRPERDTIRITHHALAYDWTGAARAMRAAGLADGYAACLETGLWPSTDVLPEAEIQTAGKVLNPVGHVIRQATPHSVENI